MTKLGRLRSRLEGLRARRRFARWGTGWSGWLLVVVWSLTGLFAVDFALEMPVSLRAIALVLLAGVAVWAFNKYTAPFLGQRESLEDMALLVERQRGIDSDLVAALQFETAAAAQWGSRQLEVAVIDYVAEFGNELDVLKGMSRGQLQRRAGWLALTVAGVAAAAAAFPFHFAAFVDRLLLGSMHYPTQTRIVAIAINGHEVHSAREAFAASRPIAVARSPQGNTVTFQVTWDGEPPTDAGRIELRSEKSGLETVLELTEFSAADKTHAAASRELVESVAYQIYLGDAWTDPARIEVVPLPVIEVRPRIHPPSYVAAYMQAAEVPAGARQLSVVEGSRVGLQVRCRNKELKSVTLGVGDKSWPLAPGNGSTGEPLWELLAADTPLATVTAALTYTLQVEDQDGLALETPFEGTIRIKSDQSPEIGGFVEMQKWLPTARPEIGYDVKDDYGIGEIKLHLEIARGKPNGEKPGAPEKHVVAVHPPTGKPILRDNLPWKNLYALDLSPYKLTKGDQLKLVLEAVDFRGRDEAGQLRPGKSGKSAEIEFEITDEPGIYAALVEADQKAARELERIRQRQLGIGESP